MEKLSIRSIACTAMVFCFCFVKCVFGGGFDNNAIGIKAMEMGHAHTGIADDASAVYYNPAGLIFNDKNVWYIETYGYYVTTQFKYHANSISDESDETNIIPGFFISKTYDSWAFGFGSYIPYAGGGTAYDNFQDTGFDLEAYAGWFAFTPVVAYKLRQDLSVGLGFSLYMGEMVGKESGVESEYEGYSGYGGHIGFLYKPSRDFSVGFTARSEVPIEMDGTVKVAGVKTDSKVKFTFPYSFTVGLGYEPISKLTLGFSVSYNMWNEMDEITVNTKGNIPLRIPTGYKNSWVLGSGLEYRTKSALSIRVGLLYDQSATKVKWLNARTTDIDNLTPSIGIAYNINESIEMNIAWMIVNGFEEKDNSKKYDRDVMSFIVGFRFISKNDMR